MFQGSELSVKTMGQAISPILDALEYDLYFALEIGKSFMVKTNAKTFGSGFMHLKFALIYTMMSMVKRRTYISTLLHLDCQRCEIRIFGLHRPFVPIRQSPNYSKGIIYTKPEENVAHYADVLKNQEGCAFVMVIAIYGIIPANTSFKSGSHKGCRLYTRRRYT